MKDEVRTSLRASAGDSLTEARLSQLGMVNVSFRLQRLPAHKNAVSFHSAILTYEALF